MPANFLAVLQAFTTDSRFTGKGPLSVALVVTQHAKVKGLPLDPTTLLTGGGGQVLGLGNAPVQVILGRHGIVRTLAAEGGRTSRGSIGKMREYVELLNSMASSGAVDLEAVERFWIDRVQEYFAAKPFKIKLDESKGLRTIVRDVLTQAEDRQRRAPGMQCVGAVLQHLVGAKLDCAMGVGQLTHHSFSTADAPGGRAGDFLLGDVVIHVTTAPSEAVIAKCRDNINAGLRPVLVTRQRRLQTAEDLADNAGIADRIDAFEIEQFIALNLYELGKFGLAGRKTAVRDVVSRYNEIVDQVETDPSLKIELAK